MSETQVPTLSIIRGGRCAEGLLVDSSPLEIIEAALEAAREMLGMDMAYLGETRLDLQTSRAVRGDGGSFGVAAGQSVPIEDSYCRLMLREQLPNLVPDTEQEPRVAKLPITHLARIGSYIGVPVVLSGGELYGTFCCLSHEPSAHLGERDVSFLKVFARLVADQLEREAGEARRRRSAVAGAEVTALLAALEARDGYTEQHSHAVVDLAVAVAAELRAAEPALEDIERAALLHDIGKIGISDAVLRKPAPLDEAEWLEMRRHPAVGARIVASMPGLAHLAPLIRAEHERWDGCGYPDGLWGEAIPLASRIVFACDAYHAMTSNRPYRRALPGRVATAELRRGAGKQFCPQTVDALVAVLERPERRFASGKLADDPSQAFAPSEVI
jgi:response regulator RpfG family c-di-GMP phosphodiesterase